MRLRSRQKCLRWWKKSPNESSRKRQTLALWWEHTRSGKKSKQSIVSTVVRVNYGSLTLTCVCWCWCWLTCRVIKAVIQASGSKCCVNPAKERLLRLCQLWDDELFTTEKEEGVRVFVRSLMDTIDRKSVV